jgi:hypothetical protein
MSSSDFWTCFSYVVPIAAGSRWLCVRRTKRETVSRWFQVALREEEEERDDDVEALDRPVQEIEDPVSCFMCIRLKNG